MFPVWIMSSSKYFEIECFVLSKFDWRKCVKTIFKKRFVLRDPVFPFRICLCQSISRSSVSCYQISIEENVETPFRKRFVLRDPVFPFWNMSLSKYFEIECFVLSKLDWIKCLNAFQKTICTKIPCVFFLDSAFVKVFRDRVYVLLKFDWRKCLNAFQKTICTKRPCVSCLD